MKRLIMTIIFTAFLTSGCSLIPRLTMDTKNTVPQSVDKSKVKDVCKGEATFTDEGKMLSCTRGYMAYSENYEKQERKMTFTERIKSFINSLIGWGFWGLILLVIFVPGIAGAILGRIVEGTIGIGAKSLKSVVTAVQRARTQGKDLNDALDAEQDADVKRYIRKLKEQKGIK